MIVRERDNEFVLITQHDHARLSGDIAKWLNTEIYLNRNRDDVVLAAYEHDRGWISLDRWCRSNEETRIPYTFMDYPLVEKLEAYKLGLNEVEAMNEYAALLASLHFVSFFHMEIPPAESIPFVQHERERQHRILSRMKDPDETCISRHLQILQFCDLFSLYVCLNEPGCSKEEEHPWHRDGIKFIGVTSHVRWLNAYEINVDRLPFAHSFQSFITYTTVSKASIQDGGIRQNLSNATWTQQPVMFLKE